MMEAQQRPATASTAHMRRYITMPMARLRELARAGHPQHTQEAASVFAARVVDIEAETRLQHDHGNPGFQPFSPAATLGEQPGGGTAAAEPLAIQYKRDTELSADRRAVRVFIQQARLHPRQLLAVLIRAAKSHPRSTGDLCRSYDDIARNLPPVAQMLGFGPVAAMGDVRPGAGAKPIFQNGMAIKNAARDARAQLVMLAQV